MAGERALRGWDRTTDLALIARRRGDRIEMLYAAVHESPASPANGPLFHLRLVSKRFVYRNYSYGEWSSRIVRQEGKAATALVAAKHRVVVVRQKQHQMRIDQPMA